MHGDGLDLFVAGGAVAGGAVAEAVAVAVAVDGLEHWKGNCRMRMVGTHIYEPAASCVVFGACPHEIVGQTFILREGTCPAFVSPGSLVRTMHPLR